MRNYGQHNALLCGIRTARAAVIFTMDDDLQQPEEIPRLLAREGFKMFTQRRTANSMVFGAPSHSASLCWRCFLLGR